MAGWDTYGLSWDSVEGIKAMLDADTHNLSKYLETIRLAALERGKATGCDCRGISRSFAGDKIVLKASHFKAIETALKTIVTKYRNHTESLPVISSVTGDTLILFRCDETRSFWTWQKIVAEANIRGMDVSAGVRLNSKIIAWWLLKMYTIINLCKVYRKQNWLLQLEAAGHQHCDNQQLEQHKYAGVDWYPDNIDNPTGPGTMHRAWSHGWGPETSLQWGDYDNPGYAANPGAAAETINVWGWAGVDVHVASYWINDTMGCGSAYGYADSNTASLSRSTSPGIHTYVRYSIYKWTPDDGSNWSKYTPEAVKRFGYYSMTELPIDFKLKIKLSGEYQVWPLDGTGTEGLGGQAAWTNHEKDVTYILQQNEYYPSFNIDSVEGFEQPDVNTIPAWGTSWSQSGLSLEHTVEMEGFKDIYEPDFQFKNW